jgi:hypothetical protein
VWVEQEFIRAAGVRRVENSNPFGLATHGGIHAGIRVATDISDFGVGIE